MKIWDWRQAQNSPSTLATMAHNAAVKALGWSPKNSSLLATGGGSLDRTLRIWNTNTGECESLVDTGSQITNLFWNDKGDQLITTHGNGERPKSYIKVWYYNKNNKKLYQVANLSEHENRVNQAAMDGGNLVSIEPENEVLFLWPIFNKTTALEFPVDLDKAEKLQAEKANISLGGLIYKYGKI